VLSGRSGKEELWEDEQGVWYSESESDPRCFLSDIVVQDMEQSRIKIFVVLR
jgi:general stress protein 26